MAIKDVLLSANLWSGALGATAAAVIQYVLGRRDEEEMKYLNEALQKQMQINQDTSAKLISTIDRMADALSSASKQAVAPIGESCHSISVVPLASGAPTTRLDQSDKERIIGREENTIQAAARFSGLITEMDMMNGNCRVALSDAEDRIPAVITDPVAQTPNNPYVRAMSEARPLSFTGKAVTDPDGNIVKLFISDTTQKPPVEA